MRQFESLPSGVSSPPSVVNVLVSVMKLKTVAVLALSKLIAFNGISYYRKLRTTRIGGSWL